MDKTEDKKLHDTLGFVGLRAQATAVGLLQLSAELKRVGVLDEDAIAREISLSRPRSPHNADFYANLRGRLDRLFAREEVLDAAPREADGPSDN